MAYKLGRLLQLLGLLILPIGVSGNLARPDDISVKSSLMIAAVGAVIFYLGWLIQQKAPPGR